MFSFIAKHRAIWPVAWLCGALGVSCGGFYVAAVVDLYTRHRLYECAHDIRLFERRA